MSCATGNLPFKKSSSHFMEGNEIVSIKYSQADSTARVRNMISSTPGFRGTRTMLTAASRFFCRQPNI
jgi:hypothetical protein